MISISYECSYTPPFIARDTLAVHHQHLEAKVALGRQAGMQEDSAVECSTEPSNINYIGSYIPSALHLKRICSAKLHVLRKGRHGGQREKRSFAHPRSCAQKTTTLGAAQRPIASETRVHVFLQTAGPMLLFFAVLSLMLQHSDGRPGIRFVGLSTGDRWLRPSDPMLAAGSPVRMQDPGVSPDWALNDAGLLTAKSKPDLCITPSTCSLANCTLLLAIPSRACMVLNGSRLIAPACQQLCAAPEGGEHDVKLARCSDSQTDTFRAV